MSKKPEEKINQHWLPASYLQFFTLDPNNQTRKGYIYRVDKMGHKVGKVETQGVSKYHYRRKNTHQSEDLFNVMEVDYPQLVCKVIAGQSLSIEEQCKFVLSLVALYCRNPSLTNQTSWENWNIFVSISNSFLENHLGAPPYSEDQESEIRPIADAIIKAQQKNPLPIDGMPSNNEAMRYAHILRFIGSHFQVAFIKRLEEDFLLYTCDHPTLLFTFDRKTSPLMLMPVTPSLLAVAYDTRFFEIRHYWLTSKDLQLIQEFLLIQADKVFFVGATEETDLHILSESLRTRERRSEGWVKEDVWQPIMYGYPELFRTKGGFDFLALRE